MKLDEAVDVLSEVDDLQVQLAESESLIALFCEFKEDEHGEWIAEMFPGVTAKARTRLEAATLVHTRTHLELERLREEVRDLRSVEIVSKQGMQAIAQAVSDPPAPTPELVEAMRRFNGEKP